MHTLESVKISIDLVGKAAKASSGEAANALSPPPRPLAARDRLDAAHLAAPGALAPELDRLRAAAEAHLQHSRAAATLRAYSSDVAGFELWCRRFRLGALPASPDTVALYLTACAEQGAAISTLRRRVVAIAYAHRIAGLPSPTRHETVRHVLAGLARERGTRPRQVTPIRLAQLRAMLEATPEDTLLDVRDRALLLLGFASGMRRSELVSLDVGDVTFVDEGADVLLRRSKTDPEGEGRVIGIPHGRVSETCPVVALRRWIGVAGLGAEDPLFPRLMPTGRAARTPRVAIGRVGSGRLSPQGVARAVQRAASRAGLDARAVAGHSLRSGFATEAAAQGAPERAIMRQTGHRSLAMVRRYIREGDRYRDNAASYLGL